MPLRREGSPRTGRRPLDECGEESVLALFLNACGAEEPFARTLVRDNAPCRQSRGSVSSPLPLFPSRPKPPAPSQAPLSASGCRPWLPKRGKAAALWRRVGTSRGASRGAEWRSAPRPCATRPRPAVRPSGWGGCRLPVSASASLLPRRPRQAPMPARTGHP